MAWLNSTPSGKGPPPPRRRKRKKAPCDYLSISVRLIGPVCSAGRWWVCPWAIQPGDTVPEASVEVWVFGNTSECWGDRWEGGIFG